jgi:hypothetical protein
MTERLLHGGEHRPASREIRRAFGMAQRRHPWLIVRYMTILWWLRLRRLRLDGDGRCGLDFWPGGARATVVYYGRDGSQQRWTSDG